MKLRLKRLLHGSSDGIIIVIPLTTIFYQRDNINGYLREYLKLSTSLTIIISDIVKVIYTECIFLFAEVFVLENHYSYTYINRILQLE